MDRDVLRRSQRDERMTFPKPPAGAGGRGGWGCRIALAIALGFVAMSAGAVAATAFDLDEFVPVSLGLAVAVGVGAGPVLTRAARRLFGSRATRVAAVSGDLLLAVIGVSVLLLGAWLAGRTEVTCVRKEAGGEVNCAIDEYRWLGRMRVVERVVPGVRTASVRGGALAGVRRNTIFARRQQTASYALELDTATGSVLVTDASRPTAHAAAEALSPLLAGNEPGSARAEIVDWLVPTVAGVLGLVFCLLPLRRAARRMRTRHQAGVVD